MEEFIRSLFETKRGNFPGTVRFPLLEFSIRENRINNTILK